MTDPCCARHDSEAEDHLRVWLDGDRANRHMFVRRTMDDEQGVGPWYVMIADANDGGSTAWAYGDTLLGTMSEAWEKWESR